MNDSQFEQLVKLLDECHDTWRIIAVGVMFGMFALWFIGFILWAKYYDKYLDIKEKKRDVIDRLSLKDSKKNIIQCLMECFQQGIEQVAEETGLNDSIKTIVEFSAQGKSQQDIDVELHRLACIRWQKNNIIRAYNTSQERFADGFDF